MGKEDKRGWKKRHRYWYRNVAKSPPEPGHGKIETNLTA